MNKKDIISAINNRDYFKSTSKLYSVLVPIIEINSELHLLYEIRSKNLRNQPNEICFPGGKMESFENPYECAIRETQEELNIEKRNIDIVNSMVPIIMPYSLIIKPFIGFLDVDFNSIKCNSDEVESIFSVPLKFLLHNAPDKYEATSVLSIPDHFPFEKIQNGKNYNWRKGKYSIYFYEYKGKIIWGLTAKITKEFIAVLKKYESDNKL